MKALVKFAGPVLAVLAMMALAARAEAGHIVFWMGGGGACAPAYRPVVVQAVVVRPVMVQPAVVQPVVVYRPVVYQPVVYQPVVYQPVVYQPVVYQPVVYQPVVYGPSWGWTYAPAYRPVRIIHAAPRQPVRHFGFRARW